MTSPYLNLPVRSLAHAEADRRRIQAIIRQTRARNRRRQSWERLCGVARACAVPLAIAAALLAACFGD